MPLKEIRFNKKWKINPTAATLLLLAIIIFYSVCAIISKSFSKVIIKSLPNGKKIDGLNSEALLTGKSSSIRNEFLYYTSRGEIQGIRQGEWKLLIKNKRSKGKNETEKFLFNLKFDLGEKNNLYENNPEIVNKLSKRMIQVDDEIEKNARSPWLLN